MAKHVSFKRLKSYWPLYLFVLPSAVLVGVLKYFPATSGMYHAFYRWDASTVNTYIGLGNFREALGYSPTLWVVFAVWVLLLMMTLTGKPNWTKDGAPFALGAWALMIGSIFLFSAVTVAGTDKQLLVMNVDAGKAMTWFPYALVPTLGGIAFHHMIKTKFSAFVQGFSVIFGFLYFFWQSMVDSGDKVLWESSAIIFVLVLAGICKMLPSIITAVVIHRLLSERWQYYYRVLFVIPMIIPGMVHLLIWKFFYDPTQGLLNKFLNATYGMTVLEKMNDWLGLGVESLHQGGSPGWLSEPKLIIPSLILWGFPWVGIVGVLIYLTGLQSIGNEIYEAADIDGINWFQKFLYIELPLIMTQVRISLVLLVIGTLQTYGFILILFGDGGGPDGVAMTPGLYMFRNAFVEGRAGYACCIGLVLFVFILVLTEINNRYVRVEK